MSNDLSRRVVPTGLAGRRRSGLITRLLGIVAPMAVGVAGMALVLTVVSPTSTPTTPLAQAVQSGAMLPTTTTTGARSVSQLTATPGTTTTTTGAKSSSGTSSSGNQLTSGSTFSGTTGSWTGQGATVTWVASPSTTGKGSLQVVSTSSNPPTIASGTPQTGGLTPASPGHVFEGTATFEAKAASVPVQSVLCFYNSSGRTLDAVWGETDTVTSQQWLTVAPAVAVAPAGTASVALGFLLKTTQAGTTLYMEQPQLLSSAGGPAPAVVGPLHASGNTIVDGQGQPITLRGIVAFGLQQTDDPPVLSVTQLAAAKTWGANMVRIPLGEQLWLSSSCDYDPNYASAVDEMVHDVTSMGMVALLELSFTQVGPGCPAAGRQLMADNPGSLQFWQQLAARYGANPLVAFDLYNEPRGISNAVWLQGGTVTNGIGVTYQAAGMQQLYDAVRGTGATNLVVVSGQSWANDVPPALIQGANIAYAVHAYTCPLPGQVPPQCTTPNPYDPSSILGPWVRFGASEPVLVTEFGWPSPLNGIYNQNVIAFAQAQHWGWTTFVWDGTTTSPWSLVAQMPSSGPFEPTPAGMPVLAALSGLPLI
ncbi:MAG: glycoside hydrolase family 5 protein [Acidimicrobiales bacterium]